SLSGDETWDGELAITNRRNRSPLVDRREGLAEYDAIDDGLAIGPDGPPHQCGSAPRPRNFNPCCDCAAGFCTLLGRRTPPHPIGHDEFQRPVEHVFRRLPAQEGEESIAQVDDADLGKLSLARDQPEVTSRINPSLDEPSQHEPLGEAVRSDDDFRIGSRCTCLSIDQLALDRPRWPRSDRDLLRLDGVRFELEYLWRIPRVAGPDSERGRLTGDAPQYEPPLPVGQYSRRFGRERVVWKPQHVQSSLLARRSA